VRTEPTRANDALAWREGPQDDLVLALCAALWLAEKNTGVPFPITVGGHSVWAGFRGF